MSVCRGIDHYDRFSIDSVLCRHDVNMQFSIPDRFDSLLALASLFLVAVAFATDWSQREIQEQDNRHIHTLQYRLRRRSVRAAKRQWPAATRRSLSERVGDGAIGSTAAFEAVNLGSSPSPQAIIRNSFGVRLQ
jgi:hypothetical protein